MKTMKFFKKPALLLSIVVIAALLAVAAIAGVGYVANGENSADFGEQYAGVSVTTQGNVNLRFYFDDFGSADTVKYQVINPKNSEVASEGQFDVATIVDEGKKTNGYPVTVPLYPSQMDYTVKVWMSGEGVDAAMAYEYSVEEYARDILAGNYTATEKDQMRALLNWGASAQSRFPEYSTKDALNANLYLRGTNPKYSIDTIPYTKGEVTYNGNAVNRENDLIIATMNMAVEAGNTEVRFYITYKGEGTLTANLYKDGVKVDAEKVGMTKVGDQYLVRIANVPVTHYDTVYTVEVTDGNNTFVANKTVREYLAVLLADCNTGDDGTAADMVTGDVLRTMYQLYQVVTGNTGAESCKHGDVKHTYWVAADADSAYVKCSLCHANVSHTAISNDINAYAPGASMQFVSNTGSYDETLMVDEDGTQFTRFDNFWPNRDNWGDIGGVVNRLSGKQGSTGQYVVIKFRVGNAGNGTDHIEFYVNTNKGTTTNLVSQGQADIASKSNNTWHTVVINLAERVKDSAAAFAPEAEGSDEYNIRYFGIRLMAGAQSVSNDDADGRYYYTYWKTGEDGKNTYVEQVNGKENRLSAEEMAEKGYDLEKIHKCWVASADAYVDIAYMATCDSEEEARSIISESTYEVSVSKTVNHPKNTADGSCAHAHNGTETVSGNTYSYACKYCGGTIFTRTIPESVSLYFSAKNIGTQHQTNDLTEKTKYDTLFQADVVGFNVDSDEAYFTVNGRDKVAQWIWNRGPGTYTNWNAEATQSYLSNVGKATHLVIKMKVTDPNEAVQLNISTDQKDSATNNTLPVKQAKSGEWVTYVMDLASVWGDQYAPNANGDYVIDTFYFHIPTFSDANNVSVAYIAFVEDGIDEVIKLVDTDKILFQSVRNEAAVEYTPETLARAAKVGIEWDANDLYDLAVNTGKGPHWSSITGKYNNIEVLTEDGVSFLRLQDGETNRAANGAWGGWFPMQDPAYSTGNNRYMVLKVRRVSSDSALSTLAFWITSKGGYPGTWAAGGFSVVLANDNEWHTIVVDLATRCGDAYKADANGKYDPYTIHIRPFGSGSAYDSTTNETIDIAYWSFFNSLEDVAEVVTDETFELSKTNSSSINLVTETLACVNCSPAYVADNSDPRGYRYECASCGKDFAMDYYESGKGGCFAYNNGQYAGTAQKLIDPAGFGYVSFLSTGSSGTFFNYNADNTGGGALSNNAVHAGRFLVMKVRGNTTADVKFHIGNDEVNKSNNNYQGGYIGSLTSTTMPKDWTIVVVDLAGLNFYELGATKKVFMSSTTGGGTTVGQGAQVDVAYMMIVDDLSNATELAKDEPVQYYGNNLANTPVDLVGYDCAVSGHAYGFTVTTGEDGSKTYTHDCVFCGDKKVQTISADINWISDLNSMNKYQYTLEKNLYDAKNGVNFNRYINNGGNHINITGGGGAGSATSGTFQTGKYVVVKYRTSSESAISLSLNVATGNLKDGNGKSVGSNQTYTTNNEWRVAVVDVSGTAQWTSDGSMQSIYIMLNPNGKCVFDVAYVAVVDSIDEAKTLLATGETYYDLGNVWGSEGVELDADGTCAGECVAVETTTEGNNFVVYSKACPCGAIGGVTKTVMQVNEPLLVPASEGKLTAQEDGTAKVEIKEGSTVIENIYRDPWRLTGGAINIGTSRYAVIRIKNGNFAEGTKVSFRFSTEATEKNYNAEGKLTSDMSVSQGVALTAEYTTYVLDLEAIGASRMIKNEDGNYYIDDCYLIVYGEGGNYYVLETLAFASDWAAIDSLTEDTTAQFFYAGNKSKTVNVADGSDAQ